MPAHLRSQFIRVNRRASLNTEFITQYDEEWVYCGDVRHENTPTALQQLRELRA